MQFRGVLARKRAVIPAEVARTPVLPSSQGCCCTGFLVLEGPVTILRPCCCCCCCCVRADDGRLRPCCPRAGLSELE